MDLPAIPPAQGDTPGTRAAEMAGGPVPPPPAGMP